MKNQSLDVIVTKLQAILNCRNEYKNEELPDILVKNTTQIQTLPREINPLKYLRIGDRFWPVDAASFYISNEEDLNYFFPFTPLLNIKKLKSITHNPDSDSYNCNFESNDNYWSSNVHKNSLDYIINWLNSQGNENAHQTAMFFTKSKEKNLYDPKWVGSMTLALKKERTYIKKMSDLINKWMIGRPFVVRTFHIDVVNKKEEIVSLQIGQKVFHYTRRHPNPHNILDLKSWSDILDCFVTKYPWSSYCSRFAKNNLPILDDDKNIIVPDHFNEYL